jgi:hypothetical protein
MLNLDNVRQKTLSSGSSKRMCKFRRCPPPGTHRPNVDDAATTSTTKPLARRLPSRAPTRLPRGRALLAPLLRGRRRALVGR